MSVSSEATPPRREGRRDRPARTAVVESVEWLTPRLVRIAFGGDDLEGFEADTFTDHYVKLSLGTKVRTYTVRAWDPRARRLTIDFVIHGDEGVAGPWAAAARPGDTLQLRGPGGAYAPAADAESYLMLGDSSVLPAIAASLARVPAGRPVRVIVQVADADDELPLQTPGDLALTWLHDASDDALLGAVQSEPWPDGPVDAFVHGEATAVRLLRRHLIGERGLDRSAISISGYWKRTRTEEGWREDKAEWNRLVEADLGTG